MLCLTEVVGMVCAYVLMHVCLTNYMVLQGTDDYERQKELSRTSRCLSTLGCLRGTQPM